MSKFLPDPQIQSLKAMRAGDIAFGLPSPAVVTIGKSNVAVAQPLVLKSITVVPAVPATQALDGTPSEIGGPIGVSFLTNTSQNLLQSISLTTTESEETLAGTPSESPVIGVGKSTSVI